MSAVHDAADIGRMMAWAARPRELPVNHDEYTHLVTR